MKTTFVMILASVLVMLSACGPKVNDPADVQAIRQSMQAFLKAADARDATAIVGLMTDKAILFEPYMPAMVGKDAIGKFYQAGFDQFNEEVSLSVGDVRVVGNLGVVHGTLKEKATPKTEGAATISVSANWMVVLQRQNDGAWKWDWVMGTIDQPMPGTTADGAEERALIQIEQDWAKALAKGDTVTLDRTLAKEWAVNLDGEVTTRDQLMAGFKTGVLQVASVTLRDLSVHVFGDVALATMTAAQKAKYKGKDISGSFRSTDFLVKREGRWQAVSTQNVTIKE